MVWMKGDNILTALKKGDEVSRDTILLTVGAMTYHPNLNYYKNLNSKLKNHQPLTDQ